MLNLNIFDYTIEDLKVLAKEQLEIEMGREYERIDNEVLMINPTIFLIHLIMETMNEANKMNYAQTSKGDFLKAIGSFTYTEELSPTPAITTLEIEISQALTTILTVPATRFTPGNNLYFITEVFNFPVGVTKIQVEAICTENGEQGNGFIAGTIDKIVDAFTYFNSVTNITESQGGSDAESEEHYRERIMIAPESFSTAGPSLAYEYFVKSYNQTIKDVKVKNDANANVEIIIILEQNGKIELPNQTFLDEVKTFISGDRLRPVTDNLILKAATEENYTIDLEYYIYTSYKSKENEIKLQVQSVVDDYVYYQKTKIGRDIVPGRLVSNIYGIEGIKRVVITSPAYKEIDDESVAINTTQNVVFKGDEDE